LGVGVSCESGCPEAKTYCLCLYQLKMLKIGFVHVGYSVITISGRLPCKAIIHTVGPRLGEGDEDTKLAFGY
jgi:O-acetyl-ADP-ribose deacetylase (regulator of RNase III)